MGCTPIAGMATYTGTYRLGARHVQIDRVWKGHQTTCRQGERVAQSQESEAGSRREVCRKGMAPTLLHQTSRYPSLSSLDVADWQSHHVITVFFGQIDEEEEDMLPKLQARGVTAKAPGTDEEADEKEDTPLLHQVLFQARLVRDQRLRPQSDCNVLHDCSAATFYDDKAAMS